MKEESTTHILHPSEKNIAHGLANARLHSSAEIVRAATPVSKRTVVHPARHRRATRTERMRALSRANRILALSRANAKGMSLLNSVGIAALRDERM